MSGFSAHWLDLRAPADQAARDTGLLDQVAALAPRRIMDLGCGTGAMLAVLHPRLPTPADWVLVDGDAGLLDQAAVRAAHLGVGAERLRRNLLADPLPISAAVPDLVTATALFDLVSAAWLDAFLDALAAHALPLYAALSYDGVMRWVPSHPYDAAVIQAFNRHQQRDKGFGGPALGPDAPMALHRGLAQRGYRVQLAVSPWRIGPDQTELAQALLDGIAAAVREEGGIAEVTEWRTARTARTDHSFVGHLDLLAIPGSG